MLILTILEKIKENRLKFSQGSVTVLKKMANDQEARVKLTNTQLNKLKPAAKNKTGTTLRLTKKNFQDEELPHELFLTTRQATKLKNVFANNMSTDIIQSDGSFGSWLTIFTKKSTNMCCYSFS